MTLTRQQLRVVNYEHNWLLPLCIISTLLALADAMEVRPKLFDCKPVQVKK